MGRRFGITRSRVCFLKGVESTFLLSAVRSDHDRAAKASDNAAQ